MKAQSFSSQILAGHKGAAVEVPFDPHEAWSLALDPVRPGRRGYAVHAIFAGFAFESHVVARSRRFWLLLAEEVLRRAGVAVGDVVRVRSTPRGDRA